MALRSGVVVGLTLGFVALAACSSGSNKTEIVVLQPEGGASSSSSGGDAIDPAECPATPTFVECLACCGFNQTAADAEDAFEQCLCDACASTCASNACNPDPDAGFATPDCQACLDNQQNTTACAPKAQTICNADPQCTAFIQCNTAANCDAKPDDVDGGI